MDIRWQMLSSTLVLFQVDHFLVKAKETRNTRGSLPYVLSHPRMWLAVPGLLRIISSID